MNAHARFTHMEDGTAEDWSIIAQDFARYAAQLPDRILTHLRLLDGDFGGFPVDRLTHSLQTATLAHRDGQDEEYVVCALLHDIGDTLGSFNHADIAAAMLKPFVSPENHWMVEKHAIFQGYYFFHHLGLDRHLREQFRTTRSTARPSSSVHATTPPLSTPRPNTCPWNTSSPCCAASSPNPGSRSTRP